MAKEKLPYIPPMPEKPKPPQPLQGLSALQRAILKTFAYRNVFSYPITFYQAFCFLNFEALPEQDKPKTFEDFKDAFVSLVKNKKILFRDNFFYTDKIDVLLRLEREKRSLDLTASAQKVANFLGLFPFIQLICLTGAVAAGNSPKEDDIDILIVAKKERLWLTRFVVVLALKLARIYRTDRHEAGKICPNIFIEDSSLEWVGNRNIYTAHEIAMMKPLFDRGHFYLQFLSQNAWVTNYLGNLVFEAVQTPIQKANHGFFNRALDHLEILLMKVQLWYMQNKKTVEVTTDKLIHFNRDDNTMRILERYKFECQKLGIPLTT